MNFLTAKISPEGIRGKMVHSHSLCVSLCKAEREEREEREGEKTKEMEGEKERGERRERRRENKREGERKLRERDNSERERELTEEENEVRERRREREREERSHSRRILVCPLGQKGNTIFSSPLLPAGKQSLEAADRCSALLRPQRKPKLERNLDSSSFFIIRTK